MQEPPTNKAAATSPAPDLNLLLDRQRTYLKLLIDAIPHLIYVKDAQGRYSLINQACADFFGLEPYQLIGKTDAEVCSHPEDLHLLTQEDQNVLLSRETKVLPEQRLHHARLSKARWYSTLKRPVPSEDGEHLALLGISTDLTERKLAEDALRLIVEGTASATAEDFFHQLVRHISAALETKCAFIGKLSPLENDFMETLAIWKGNYYAENERYHIRGTPSAEIIKHGIQYYEKNLQSIFPEDPSLKRHGLDSYLGVPVYDSRGRTLGVMAVMDDKPVRDWPAGRWIMRIFAARAGAELERLFTEEESKRLQHQLLHAQKMEAIGQLAAGVAHDLNNALGAVVGHLQLIKMDNALSSEAKQSIDTALGGCERASSLIQQLLGFSRHGKYKLERLRLHDLVSETIRFLGRIVAKGIKIVIKEIPGDITVCGDPGQLQQALTNLIINAMHAMPQGGTITFSSSSKYITSPQHLNPKAQSGNYVLLSISDTGVGIKPEHIGKIFEPFFTTKDFSQGTGLGLAMVYSIMQNHGGWVEVQSKPGEGATFVLYLPLSVEANDECCKEEMNVVSPGRGMILVVDDESVLVELAVRFLEKSGHRAKGFTAAEDAMEWYRANFKSVDMIVLDVKMPGIGGEECFDQLRKINPEARVVILSGYVHDDTAEALLKKGALKFFQKPLQYPELIQWINAFLAHSK